MVDELIESKQQESLNLQDLLLDEQANEISDYLSLNIENIGEDTRVSITTVEESPVTYSTTLCGVSLSDLQYLVESSNALFGE